MSRKCQLFKDESKVWQRCCLPCPVWVQSAFMQTGSDIIECKVTPWYLKRMGLMAAMFLVFGLLFFKDGAYSWPKEAAMAAERERYQTNVLDAYDLARTAGTLSTWQAEAKAKGIELNPQNEPLPWAAVAAKQGWPEKPKKRTPTEIEQQFYWGGAMMMGMAIVVTLILLSRNKKLIGYADHFITPEGQRVNHADAFRIDKRKWEQKALAYVFYREGGEGPTRKATIDDLKYAQAGQVLDGLMANFHGELIEKQAEAQEPAQTDPPSAADR